MNNTVSYSGGRTSAYLCHLMKRHDTEAKYIFCDTGFEDPLTYKFVRQCDKHLNLDLVCLRSVTYHNTRKTNGYEVIGVNEIGVNPNTMLQASIKYGAFTNNRPWCTDKLKTIPSKKYRDDTFGKGNYTIWLGIRWDEPKRLVGAAAYKQLVAADFSDDGVSELFVAAKRDLRVLQKEYNWLDKDLKQMLRDRIGQQEKLGLRYLAEISQFSKGDVIDWWSQQSFDLEINEHLGNCMFCVKKSELKVACAQRDRPLEFQRWVDMVDNDLVRLMPADKFGKGRIYRKWLSPEMLIAQFSDHTTDELKARMRGTKALDTGSCSESCEAFPLEYEA